MWWKDMTDSQIAGVIIGLSENAVKLMQEGQKDESLEVRKELIDKGRQLREHISEIKGAYSAEMLNFYNVFMMDIEQLIINTGEKMLQIHKGQKGA